ncbi:MAG: PspA/IM30 family protein [Candidatus Azobacteroides sp.]|nr:PspA/IM30 family protein [Candidatus Azobacteroides sp.]
MLQLNGVNTTPKSMWEQPGGKLGMVVCAGLIVGGIIFLYKILPFLIKLAENTLYFGLLLGVIGLITFLCFDKKFRRVVSVGYFILMRKITSLFVNIDPIAIIERRLGMMEKSIQKMNESMGRLLGQIRKLEGSINSKKEEMEKLLQRAQVYRAKGNRDAAVIDERQIARLEKYINKLLGLLQDSKRWYESLDKLSQMAKLTVLDTRNEVNMQKEEYEMAKQQHKIFRSVMSIMEGDPDELALFNEALEAMRADIENKLGEMERVISSTGGLIDQFEADNDVASFKGNELINRYNELGIEGIFKTFENTIKINPSKTAYFSKNEIVDVKPIEISNTKGNQKSIPDRNYFDQL